MSLEDDVKTVYNALKGSSHDDWPEPRPGEFCHHAFGAFQRICDGVPALRSKYPAGLPLKRVRLECECPYCQNRITPIPWTDNLVLCRICGYKFSIGPEGGS